MNKFDIGDHVKVLTIWEQYSSYKSWFDLDGNEKAKPYKTKFKPLNDVTRDSANSFVVLAKHTHEDGSDMIYCISSDGGNTVHLFSKYGLELDLFNCPDIVVR